MNEGFLSGNERDWLTIAGMGLTAVGFFVAFLQLKRVGDASQAAKKAAQESHDAIIANLQLSDLTSAARRVSEIDNLIRDEQYDASSLRLSDLRELVIQIRTTSVHSQDVDLAFQQSIAVIAELQDALLGRHYGKGKPMNPIDLHKRLRTLADFLNERGVSTKTTEGKA